MKKKDLKTAMIKGITIGVMLSPISSFHIQASDQTNSDFLELIATTKGNITFKEMTEDDLLLELNEEGAEHYRSLSPEGRKLALKLASRSCNNMNDCKGENACATDKNKCAGKGSCKGQTKCAFSDKNLAIKVASKKMAEKRKELQLK